MININTANKVNKYLDQFEYSYRQPNNPDEDKKEGFWCFTNKSINEDTPEHKALTELIYTSDLDNDSAYTFTVEALEAMKEKLSNNEELDEYLDGFSEAPIYNSQLTEWFGKGSNWSYIDDVLLEIGYDWKENGILTAIGIGYTQAWEENYFKVLEIVLKN